MLIISSMLSDFKFEGVNTTTKPARQKDVWQRLVAQKPKITI